MLKQILKDMYVDPELLAELPEEQQQILFFKIREEQKRRYYEHEKQVDKKPVKKLNKKKSSKPTKHVRILEDSINQPWTWIMGEHPNDIPLEEIWDNLGNKDWKPAKNRDQPISKVQALIYAKNKNNPKSNNITQQKQPMKENNSESLNMNNSNSVKTVQGSEAGAKSNVTNKPNVVPKPSRIAEKPVQKMASNKTPVSPAPTPSSISSSPSANVGGQPTKPSPDVKNDTVDSKIAKSTPPPIPTKPPAGKIPKPKVTVDDNSDSDEYENMAELADTLPNLREKELEDKEWKTQLKRFKDADRRRSLNARRAGMQIKRQSQLNLVQKQKLKTLKTRFERQRSQREIRKPALPPKPTHLRPKHPAPCAGRSAKPATKSEAVQWFKETQTAEILASLDDNNKLPVWFHGLITRQKAESLLENKKPGDFLIRVSEKIWGYALSYKDEHKIKHFLIDASEANCYHFFGNDQIRHPDVEQLVAFHLDEAISYGGEILKNGVGQEDLSNPDYGDLIDTSQSTSEGMNRITNDTAF